MCGVLCVVLCVGVVCLCVGGLGWAGLGWAGLGWVGLGECNYSASAPYPFGGPNAPPPQGRLKQGKQVCSGGSSLIPRAQFCGIQTPLPGVTGDP